MPVLALGEDERGIADGLATGQAGRRFTAVAGIEAATLRRAALHLAATDARPDVVAAALRALGDMNAEFLADERLVLRAVVRNHLANPDLAGFAAHAAPGAYAADDAADAMQEALARTLATHLRPGLRAECARALVRAPRVNAAAVAALKKAGLDPFPCVRLEVAGAGGYVDTRPPATSLWPEFRLLLAYHHALVRATAAITVGETFTRGSFDATTRSEAVARLRPLFGDRWGRVRCAAIDAAAASGEPALVHDLVPRIADDVACGEQPEDLCQAFDGTQRPHPPGPDATVARRTFAAIDALVGEQLRTSLRRAWEKAGTSPRASVRATRTWYAKAKVSLPAPIADGVAPPP
jgi:hypothetical protein